MRTLFSTLTLLPAALAAQAPAVQPAPAAPAPAQSLQDQFKAQSPAIEALIKTDPAAALAKAEAMIPAQPLPFDKTNITTAQASMNQYESLSDLYALAANAALHAGQWEKGKDYAAKAKATALANYDNAQAPLTSFQDSWKKAQAESQANLDEEAALIKNEHPTADQIKRMQFLQTHDTVFKSNVANGQKMVDAVSSSLDGLKAAPAGYDSAIQSIDKHLQEEADYLAKVKGDKHVYANALLRSADTNSDKVAALAGLRRALVVDPSNKAVAHKIDVLTGKAKDEPAKPTRRHKKSH